MLTNLSLGNSLYSFFDNYAQTCLATESCQEHILAVDCSADVLIWGLTTKASTNMLTIDGRRLVPQVNNHNNFCSTVAVFEGV